MSDAAKRDEFDELYRKYLELPEGTSAEIAAGEIRVVPRPRPPHARAATKLTSRLESAFGFDSDGPGGWVLLIEPEIRFGDQLRAPDLAGWRVDRYAEPEEGPFMAAPDFICEVLSTRTAKYDRGEKMPLYASHGVEHLWLVDPSAHTLEIYRREGSLWLAIVTHTGEAVVRAEPFEEIELDLGSLWRKPGVSA